MSREFPVLHREKIASVANIQPTGESDRSIIINRIAAQGRRRGMPDQSGAVNAKNVSMPPQKEVRVNIGRLEIKASQSNSPRVDRTVRGFDDYLMMRLYLDKHYV